MEGRTPLFLATELEEVEIMAMLIAHAADPGVPNLKGETCLNALVGKNNEEALNILLSKGTSILNIKDPNSNGRTPLIKAILSDDSTMAGLLLAQSGTMVDLQDNDGKSALMFSVEYQRSSITEQLLKLGAHVNQTDKKGQTALHTACLLMDSGAIQQLADRTANVTALDAAGVSPLHCLVKKIVEEPNAGDDVVENIESCIRIIHKVYNNPKSREDMEAEKSQRDRGKTAENILNTQDGQGNTILHLLATCWQQVSFSY